MNARLSYRVLLLTLASMCATCASAVRPTVLRSGQGSAKPSVLVVQSGSTRLHEVVLESFRANTTQGLSRLMLEADSSISDEALRAMLEEQKPGLILALGSVALLRVREVAGNTPILFTLAMNSARLGLEQFPNVMGIAMESPALGDFTRFKVVMPQLRRVVVLRSSDVAETVMQQARRQLGEFGITLDIVDVPDDQDPVAALDAYRDPADAFWISSGVKILKSFKTLRDACGRRHLPVLASLSDAFARNGALMAASVDISALGAQAAAMADMVLENGAAPAEIGVQYPNTTQLVLNTEAAAALGYKIAPEVLPFIDLVLDVKTSP